MYVCRLTRLIQASKISEATYSYFGTLRNIDNKRIVLNTFYTYLNRNWSCSNGDDDYNKVNVVCEMNGGHAYPVHPGSYAQVSTLHWGFNGQSVSTSTLF